MPLQYMFKFPKEIVQFFGYILGVFVTDYNPLKECQELEFFGI